MSGATPRPWKWCGNDIEGPDYAEVMSPDVQCGQFCQGGLVRLNICGDDRELIVRAVNAHDDLLAACEAAREVLTVMFGARKDGPGRQAYEKLGAAIEKARHVPSTTGAPR